MLLATSGPGNGGFAIDPFAGVVRAATGVDVSQVYTAAREPLDL